MPPGWKNRGRAPAGFDFALDAMIVCFFYPLLLIIYHAAGCGVSAWLLPLPFAALAALSTLVRRAARGTVVFLPVQAALTAAAGAVCVLISSGHIAAAVFACILCLISSIITTVKYTHRLAELDENRRDPTSPPSNLYAGGWLLALGCVFFYAAFILTIALDLPAYRAADVVCCSVFLIVYFIYSHLSGSQSVLSGPAPSPSGKAARRRSGVSAAGSRSPPFSPCRPCRPSFTSSMT
jgi:hypothetical protein